MKKYIFSLLVILSLAPCTLLSARTKQAAELTPTSLTCEDMTNPPVLNPLSEHFVPRFSWVNTPSSEALTSKQQTAYQLRVYSRCPQRAEARADVWDSGKVSSDASYLVSYSGPQLTPGADYWWAVRVWDERGVVSQWSEPATFGLGISEWRAQWIGAPWQGEGYTADYAQAPMFRKTFALGKNVRKVKAYITAMGMFELYANGQKVSGDCLVPNFTNFTTRDDLVTAGIPISNHFRDYRILYLAYNLTDHLREGDNTLGVLLGNGWANTISHWVTPFGSPRFICQLDIEYTNGHHAFVVTDESWLSKPSALLKNDVYGGEVYDARQESMEEVTTSVSSAAADGWQPAALRQAPVGRLTAHDAPTDRLLETLRPTALTHGKDGTWTVRFDHEISGYIALDGIQAKPGQEISIRYLCESPLGEDRYICRGDGTDRHVSHFTWYVFSQAVISGIDHLDPSQVEARSIGTDVPVNARFESSDRLLNRINTIWQQSQIDNMHCGIASDCPHRERSPYTGDGQVASPAVFENFDATAFYRKWLRDMRDTQNVDDGYVPNSAPWQPGCGGGVAWGAAMNVIPWEFYLHTGDLRTLRDNFFAMKEQMRHMQQWITPRGTMFSKKQGLASEPLYWLNLGDWAPAYALPSDELVHTFYLWYCADCTARAAHALGAADDEATYRALADRTAAAFHRTFYDAERKTYGPYGSNVFALRIGVPADRRADVVATLEQEIGVEYNGHLNTGIFGTRFLFETLAENGLNELALRVLRQTDFPSFGHWIEQGATVTWEQWNGNDSRNHPMFGGGLVYLYRYLAGVRLDESQPGYRHVVVRPFVSPSLPRASYEKLTPYGLLRSEVRRSREAGRWQLNLTLPVGTTATVILPDGTTHEVAQGPHTFVFNNEL